MSNEIKFNPVEKNLFMSLEDILIDEESPLYIQFSIENIEEAIKESGAHIDGRLSDLLPNQINYEEHTYIALLSESTAVVNIFPKKKHASVYISTCGSPNPINSIEPFVYLFRPKTAKVRVFTSSSIDSAFKEYFTTNEEKFWQDFDNKRVPYYYKIQNKEREKNGIYFDLIDQRRIPSKPKEAILVENEIDVLISMYGVSKDALINYYENFRKEERIEDIVANDLNKVTGLMYKSFPSLDPKEFLMGMSYILKLEKGAFAMHVTPEQNYVSVYYSSFDDKIPYNLVNEVLDLFSPQYAETRIFSTTNLKDLDPKQINSNFSIRNLEDYKTEFYIDLLKRDD
ncbi:MAG: hypothetical protein PWP03_162 [Candidatus Woesearchaeota archaeon]|nr:hypothetical protein [Candidatus Woesearchaeota archaeon]MDN5327524.1 hypothetical protein [Candidatus Woesearchaeota archaeon]